MTDDEFNTLLPPRAYTYVAGNAAGQRIGIVERGESGYYLTTIDDPTLTEASARKLVAHMNKRLGVTKAQAGAMELGSCFGWDVPAADPRSPIHAD